jgi:hypothetical protein
VFVAGWQLCVDPSAGLDFGTVTIGQSQTKQITFTNCGSTDFVISQFTFAPYAPTTSQFTISTGTLPAAGSTFATGAAIALSVTYKPSAVQSDKASFDYMLAVGSNAIQGSVPVVAKGAAGACGGSTNPTPAVVASYGTTQNGANTNFNPTTTPSPVIPLDWVKLNASTSTVPNGTPTYTWQLTSQPNGSTTSFVGGTTSATGVQAEFQALVSGTYVVLLTVKDANNCTGTETITINVVPQGDVHIELTWAESCADIDLHYVAPNNSQCGFNDCFYGNPNPSWGASLDHDDLWGNGPENITHKTNLANGTYQVYVYYYSATPDDGTSSGTCGTVHPTVNIYIKGALVQSYTLTNGFTGQQLWHAANIVYSNTGSNFVVSAGSTTLGSSCE